MDRYERRVVYVMVCGSPRAARIGELIALAREQGWDVWVIATPSGLEFMDREAVEKQTGHPVHWRFRTPGEPKVLPPADGIIAAAMTFNSICKLATGISDTLVVGMLIEAIGLGVPTVLCPSLNSAQAAHWAFERHLAELRSAGVQVIYGPGVYLPAAPGVGGRPYSWQAAFDALVASQRR